MAKMFTTPQSLPDGVACRTLEIPNDGIWLGIFNSALLETVNAYNWEQTYPEDMTIEETVAVCQEIINEYWETGNCTDDDICLQPDGYRVLRLNLLGHIEQLFNGAWTTPDGDYEIPPTEARDEPTAVERKCAAAANAQNVLQQTYEVATDAIAEGITVAELAVIMATELTLLLGPAFGFIVPAFIFLLEAAALAFIEIAEFMSTDVWDAEFSDLLLCALLDCASDDGEVVTFDYQCVIDNLAKNVDLLNPLAQSQLLLFGQVNFMLSIIGIDGLNTAGATTAVTDANCDDCGGWCYEIDFTETNGGWGQVSAGTSGLYGTYSSGNGWTTTDAVDTVPNPDVFNRMFYIGKTLAASATFTHVEIDLYYVKGSFFSNRRAQGIEAGLAYATTIIDINSTPASNGAPLTLTWDGELVSNSIVVFARSSAVTGSPVYSGSAILTRIKICGTGENPFGTSNCEC